MDAVRFIDGNKRTAAIAMEAFLILNGYELPLSDDQVAEMFEALGADEIGQTEFFDRVSAHAREVKS